MLFDATAAFVRLEDGFRNHLANAKGSPDYKRSVVIYWGCVRALAKLCELTPEQAQLVEELNARVQRPFGISDAMRSILYLAEKPMTPLQIREALIDMGFDMRKYSFAMACVHSTLKRLANRGEFKITTLGDGRKLYEWNKSK